MIDGATVRRIRKWMGKTQPQFAKGLGVNISTVWRWEHDHTRLTGPALKFMEGLQSEMETEATDA